MNIRFVLVCEGSSDTGLVGHLQFLCVQCGASEATGTAPDFSMLPRPVARDVRSKVSAALALDPSANLVFVHRDADARSEQRRKREIERGSADVGVPVVPIIPIQETEAWLLLDENAIRAAVENPRGTRPLNLPKPAAIERVANPKGCLRAALETASEARGRRLTTLRKDFSRHRFLLLQGLDTTGPVTELTAWKQLLQRTGAALTRVV